MEKDNKVYICECWARDGLQNMEKIIATQDKIDMLNAMSKAGLKRMEAGSFSNPKKVRQFADIEEVLRRIDRIPGVTYKTICINGRALDRAIEAKKNGYGPVEISTMISVSEAHNKINTGMTHEEHWKEIENNITKARAAGLNICNSLGTVFGCPVSGVVPFKDVLKFVDRYVSLGASLVSLGDTTGAANPFQVKEMFGELIARYPKINFLAHFHDTRGTGIANCVAAYEAGVRYFDSSLGAIGGQPAGGSKYHLGFSGNVSTEDLVCMFNEMGIDTGIASDDVIDLGIKAEKIIGTTCRSNVIRCGKVVH